MAEEIRIEGEFKGKVVVTVIDKNNKEIAKKEVKK